MEGLKLYEEYSREEAHDILSPITRFTPSAGSWGLHGIVAIREQPGDYVFFVTFGQQQGEYVFDEWVTEAGVISWQSQPRQDLEDATIQRLIHHDENKNKIYLLLREKAAKYSYLGEIKYLAHHPKHENPVWIYWQILRWDIPATVLDRMNLILRKDEVSVEKTIQDAIGDRLTKNDYISSPAFGWKSREWKVDSNILFEHMKKSGQPWITKKRSYPL